MGVLKYLGGIAVLCGPLTISGVWAVSSILPAGLGLIPVVILWAAVIWFLVR